jgi:adenine-specific DNA-methyltransferase
VSSVLAVATSPVEGSSRPSDNGLNPKLNGVYYTPPRLAGILSDWALKKNPERILEPAYGGGVFLQAAHEALIRQGVPHPESRLFGVEIDPAGPTRLLDRGLRLPSTHLHEGDLLSLDVDALGGCFEAIVGNPPYIRHHLLSKELADRGREGAVRLGIDLNGRSDAWTYFCAHLVTFLAPRGRLALVLPGSVLQAEYAAPLLDALASEKGEVQLIRISQRLFRGVQERTVLLLIDRGQPAGDQVVYRRIADLKGLARGLQQPRKRQARKVSQKREDYRLPWRLTAVQAAAWEEVCADERIQRLGDLGKVRIGVVTGANSFFIRSAAEADSLGKAVRSVPIVSRGAWLNGPRWDHADQQAVAAKPSRLLLLPGGESKLSKAAKKALRAAERELIDRRSHCVRRTPWYTVRDQAVPDLFLPYMASGPPRLVLNDTRATCTNAIHRVWLHSDERSRKESIAAASWTTLYRLSAELCGRTYGGGILKLEPNGATELRLALVDPALFSEIAEAFDSGGVEEARAVADRRILIEGLGVEAKTLETLRTAAEALEHLRRR